jgi:hypothetical protein
MSFKGYDNADSITYVYPAASFSTPVVRTLRGPKGKRGTLREVTVNVTTSFVGTTTPGILRVGDGTTVNKYADINIGAAGAGPAANATVVMSDNRLFDKNPDGGITPDSNVVITPVAPTGGAPAGAGDILVTIDWY